VEETKAELIKIVENMEMDAVAVATEKLKAATEAA
jgi:hypothetical protein